MRTASPSQRPSCRHFEGQREPSRGLTLGISLETPSLEAAAWPERLWAQPGAPWQPEKATA